MQEIQHQSHSNSRPHLLHIYHTTTNLKLDLHKVSFSNPTCRNATPPRWTVWETWPINPVQIASFLWPIPLETGENIKGTFTKVVYKKGLQVKPCSIHGLKTNRWIQSGFKRETGMQQSLWYDTVDLRQSQVTPKNGIREMRDDAITTQEIHRNKYTVLCHSCPKSTNEYPKTARDERRIGWWRECTQWAKIGPWAFAILPFVALFCQLGLCHSTLGGFIYMEYTYR